MRVVVIASGLGFIACMIWLVALLMSEKRAEVIIASMDKCINNIGTIDCGKKYEIRILSRGQNILCTNSFGFNNAANRELVHSDGCYESNGDNVKLFGAMFIINRENGDIINAANSQTVGRIEYQ